MITKTSKVDWIPYLVIAHFIRLIYDHEHDILHFCQIKINAKEINPNLGFVIWNKVVHVPPKSSKSRWRKILWFWSLKANLIISISGTLFINIQRRYPNIPNLKLVVDFWNECMLSFLFMLVGNAMLLCYMNYNSEDRKQQRWWVIYDMRITFYWNYNALVVKWACLVNQSHQKYAKTWVKVLNVIS